MPALLCPVTFVVLIFSAEKKLKPCGLSFPPIFVYNYVLIKVQEDDRTILTSPSLIPCTTKHHAQYLLGQGDRGLPIFSYFLWRRERSKETSTPYQTTPYMGCLKRKVAARRRLFGLLGIAGHAMGCLSAGALIKTLTCGRDCSRLTD